MTRAPRGCGWALVVMGFVACVWLNQAPGQADADWNAYRDGVVSSPSRHWLDTLRYPFAYLYRRASDERLYYETANLLLGRAADVDFIRRQRGRVSGDFEVSSRAADGRWHAPYRDVPLEYPAMVLPFILVPRLLTSSLYGFGLVFDGLMGLCLVAAIVASLDAARICGVDERGLRSRAWLASGLLLAQGAIAVQRFDAITALWLALAVRAAVRRRAVAAGAWTGLAAATKFVPVLVVPALVAALEPTSRRSRQIAYVAMGFGAALVAGLAPMFLFSSSALERVVSYHAARGLEYESTLGLLLATAHLLLGHRTPATLSYGSDNLDGSTADALAALCGPLSVAASVGIALLVWNASRRAGERSSTPPVA
ncbi:MAG: DUF2029 domain-containing protein, partial [Myxococcales bacterium]|nr:DUF2029 domain-containing protein [Myxococcales bacterium]